MRVSTISSPLISDLARFKSSAIIGSDPWLFIELMLLLAPNKSLRSLSFNKENPSSGWSNSCFWALFTRPLQGHMSYVIEPDLIFMYCFSYLYLLVNSHFRRIYFWLRSPSEKMRVLNLLSVALSVKFLKLESLRISSGCVITRHL